MKSNVSLKGLNTFHIDVKAHKYLEIDSLEEAREFISSEYDNQQPLLILGGGSNILFTHDFDGLVLKINIGGIELIKETEDHYYVKAGAGVNWHNFVLHCIENNYAGIENLSLIPGNVGASPMQNIGAYGVEVKDVIETVEAIELATGNTVLFTNAECDFSYRTSVFKNHLKNKLVITSVVYRLNKTPNFNVTYGAIKQELEKLEINDLSIKAISQAVCNIRNSKLPDPKQIGNAGSFFKNPVVSAKKLSELQKNYEDLPFYKVSDSEFKVAAGWLIEKCGWKGKKIGDYGVHVKQALVLVNYDNAKGSDIYQLSQDILESVKEKFNIELEREVNII